MTTERAFYPRDKQQSRRRPVDGGVALVPSRRVVVSPKPGTDDADFFDNLNEVYGATTPEDGQVIEGIRRTQRSVLDEPA